MPIRPDQIRAALEEILPLVQQPARYLGLERNLVRKPWDSVPLHVALAFPDAYEIGMSHQGSQILYHLVNRRPDAVAERSYAPMPDMAAALHGAGIPLFTLESYHPLDCFEIVGISLQSELNYINVPYLLDLAGIPRRAEHRGAADPIVLGGGPCTANPEPVAPFFDALLIGDAEAGLDAVLDAVRDARAGALPRTDLLRRLAGLPGVYVPGLYRWHRARADEPARWEASDPEAPMPVRRVWVEELDEADQPELPIVPFAEVIQDRLGMEIMRGCTQGCRFCQAGYWYRPVREHDPGTIAERLERQAAETGFEEVGLLSLSTADYSQVAALTRDLAARVQARRVSLSLPSLRADAFSVGLAEAVSSVRKSGFTFAPETGSDRLRRVINKSFGDPEMLEAAEAAFAKGWNLIKLYAMIGLPTETDEDLEDLVRLAAELVAVGRRVRRGRAQVKVSVSPFIPKAWTPFQWEPYLPVTELHRRLELLRDRFRRLRGARLVWSDPESSALEALLSRGDRSLASTIERAHDLGSVLDGWSDHLRLDAWHRAIAEAGVDMERELGPRGLDETLPWSIIDAGIDTRWLRAERRRGLSGTVTPDCRWGPCLHCGLPGDGDEIRLATPASGSPSDSEAEKPTGEPSSRSKVAGRMTPQPPVYRRYRVTFRKCGDARFLSHRQVMDGLQRALRAAEVPTRYTEGYNPHIRLSMGSALAVGHEGLAEVFDVDCTAPLRRHHLEAANRRLPQGLELTAASELVAGAPSLGKMVAAARYRIAPQPGRAWPGSETALPEEVRNGVHRWSLDVDGSLSVVLNLRQEEGPTPSAKNLLAALGMTSDTLALVRVTREGLVLRPRTRQPG